MKGNSWNRQATDTERDDIGFTSADTLAYGQARSSWTDQVMRSNRESQGIPLRSVDQVLSLIRASGLWPPR